MKSYCKQKEKKTKGSNYKSTLAGQVRDGQKTGPIQIVGVRTCGSWLKDETNTYVRWQDRNVLATRRDQYKS